jgi:hypothetical protein
MSRRLDKSWVVFKSIENAEHNKCVDVFLRPDQSFGFEEFRRDAEDEGRWTPVGYYSGLSFDSEKDAVAAALRSIRWFNELFDPCADLA